MITESEGVDFSQLWATSDGAVNGPKRWPEILLLIAEGCEMEPPGADEPIPDGPNTIAELNAESRKHEDPHYWDLTPEAEAKRQAERARLDRELERRKAEPTSLKAARNGRWSAFYESQGYAEHAARLGHYSHRVN